MRVEVVRDVAMLAACLDVRRAVFIVEQGVPEAEEIDALDALDTQAIHVAALLDGNCIGTARLWCKGHGLGKVQRVAVLQAHRGKHVGVALMTAIEQLARERQLAELTLGAQLTALPFYERLGYIARGDVYLDAGIPHRDMDKRLTMQRC